MPYARRAPIGVARPRQFERRRGPRLREEYKSFTVGFVLTQKTRYALRALLFLIEEGDGGAIRLQRIAESQKIPRKYLELIMLDLKAADLVESVRGPKGGYRLTRHPRLMSFGEVVRALEGPIGLVPCASVNFYKRCDDCHDEATCAIRRIFMMVRDRTADVLNSVTLEDGARWELRLEGQADPSRLESDAASNWQI